MNEQIPCEYLVLKMLPPKLFGGSICQQQQQQQLIPAGKYSCRFSCVPLPPLLIIIFILGSTFSHSGTLYSGHTLGRLSLVAERRCCTASVSSSLVLVNGTLIPLVRFLALLISFCFWHSFPLPSSLCQLANHLSSDRSVFVLEMCHVFF